MSEQIAIRDVVEPQPTRLGKAVVYRIAEQVAKQAGYAPGGDILAALKALGGTVRVKEFGASGEGDSGSLVVNGPGNFEVYVASNTSLARDRFTIAHEIGHYVLHFLWPRHKGKKISKLIATRFGSDPAEWEANWFAAAFLMPEKEFLEAFRVLQSSTERLAAQFKVSALAAQTRAKALGLI